MNDFSDHEPDLPQRLAVIVPLALIALIALGNVLFGLLAIWPSWQDTGRLRAVVTHQVVALTATAQAVLGAEEVLQHQIDDTQGRLGEAAGVFLTAAQADDMLDLLYRYAQETGVELAKLQLEPDPAGAASDAFKARTFQIEVTGEPRDLLRFLVHFKEARVPGVALASVTISRANSLTTLTARLTLHSSPFAPGGALDGAAQPPVITPTAPTPTPFRLLPTATPTRTPTPVILDSPTPTPTAPPLTFTPSPTLPAPSPTPTPPPDLMPPGTHNDDSPLLRYARGHWILIASLRGSDASYRYSEDADAEASFAFEGTGARVQYVSFRNFGIFEVYVNGALWTAVDAYAPVGTFGREVVIDGLPYGTHTVTIRNTGRRNPASEGTVIALDAIHIPAAIPPSPTPALPSFGAG